jgi:hypothetical protein
LPDWRLPTTEFEAGNPCAEVRWRRAGSAELATARLSLSGKYDGLEMQTYR